MTGCAGMRELRGALTNDLSAMNEGSLISADKGQLDIVRLVVQLLQYTIKYWFVVIVLITESTSPNGCDRASDLFVIWSEPGAFV